MKKVKGFVAAVAAVVIQLGAIGGSTASAYSSKGSWSTRYVHGAPNSPTSYTGSVTMYTYGGGYQTYCASLTGSNDRYVTVSASGMVSYNITSTGYSVPKSISTSSNQVTMHFSAHSGGNATANGTAGYYN